MVNYLKSEMILVKNSTTILMVMMIAATMIVCFMMLSLSKERYIYIYIYFSIFSHSFGILQFDCLCLFYLSFSLADFQAGPRHFSTSWKQPYSHFLLHRGRFIICCKVCSKLDQESIIVFKAVRSDSFLANFLDFNSLF